MCVMMVHAADLGEASELEADELGTGASRNGDRGPKTGR